MCGGELRLGPQVQFCETCRGVQNRRIRVAGTAVEFVPRSAEVNRGSGCCVTRGRDLLIVLRSVEVRCGAGCYFVALSMSSSTEVGSCAGDTGTYCGANYPYFLFPTSGPQGYCGIPRASTSSASAKPRYNAQSIARRREENQDIVELGRVARMNPITAIVVAKANKPTMKVP